MDPSTTHVLTLDLRPADRVLDVSLGIRIDGHDLVDVVREIERPHAIAAGTPGSAGSYGPLQRCFLSSFAAEFMGLGRSRGETVLLACDCGELACRPLWARIERSERRVLWCGFHQPYRPHWDLSALSFQFDRAAYESEVERIQSDLFRLSDVRC